MTGRHAAGQAVGGMPPLWGLADDVCDLGLAVAKLAQAAADIGFQVGHIAAQQCYLVAGDEPIPAE